MAFEQENERKELLSALNSLKVRKKLLFYSEEHLLTDWLCVLCHGLCIKESRKDAIELESSQVRLRIPLIQKQLSWFHTCTHLLFPILLFLKQPASSQPSNSPAVGESFSLQLNWSSLLSMLPVIKKSQALSALSESPLCTTVIPLETSTPLPSSQKGNIVHATYIVPSKQVNLIRWKGLEDGTTLPSADVILCTPSMPSKQRPYRLRTRVTPGTSRTQKAKMVNTVSAGRLGRAVRYTRGWFTTFCSCDTHTCKQTHVLVQPHEHPLDPSQDSITLSPCPASASCAAQSTPSRPSRKVPRKVFGYLLL